MDTIDAAGSFSTGISFSGMNIRLPAQPLHLHEEKRWASAGPGRLGLPSWSLLPGRLLVPAVFIVHTQYDVSDLGSGQSPDSMPAADVSVSESDPPNGWSPATRAEPINCRPSSLQWTTTWAVFSSLNLECQNLL
jgi:hypothetical protein